MKKTNKDLAKIAVGAFLIAAASPAVAQGAQQAASYLAAGCGGRAAPNRGTQNSNNYWVESDGSEGSHGCGGRSGCNGRGNNGSGRGGNEGSGHSCNGRASNGAGYASGCASHGCNSAAPKSTRDDLADNAVDNRDNLPTKNYDNYNTNRNYSTETNYGNPYESSSNQSRPSQGSAGQFSNNNLNRNNNTAADYNYNRATTNAGKSTYTWTEAQLLTAITPQSRTIYLNLDPEGKALAVQLASQDSYQDKNLAIKEAQRIISERRSAMPK